MSHFEEYDDEHDDYAVLISNFKYWQNKELYLELMERFLKDIH